MSRLITVAVLAVLASACGPEDHEPEAPGVLEYEDSYLHMYRLDRRIEAIGVAGDPNRRKCGMLSDRAYTELEDTFSALEPSVDYDYEPDAQECDWAPGAFLHIEGFEHSPFACDVQCCHPELFRAGLIYWLVATYFEYDDALEFDGEPYIAIEPDEPCP